MVDMLTDFTLPDDGALFVVSGPTGVGKTTLIHQAMRVIPGLEFSVSATTRAARKGETEGVDYSFLDEQTFQGCIDKGDFIESATVYGHQYGTLRGTTENVLKGGRSLVLDIDVRGATQIRQHMPEAVLIYVLPPSLGELEQRLKRRGTESDAAISARLDLLEEQLEGCSQYDYLIVNAELDQAHQVFQGVLLGELSRRDRRKSWIEHVRAQWKNG